MARGKEAVAIVVVFLVARYSCDIGESHPTTDSLLNLPQTVSTEENHSASLSPTKETPQEYDKPDCDKYDNFVRLGLCGTFAVTGFIGNVLSFLALWPDRQRSATVFLLLALAVVDNVLLVSWSTFAVLPQALLTAGHHQVLATILPYLQVYTWPFASLIHMMNTYMTVMLAIQRWILVCRPHLAKKYGSIRFAQAQLAFVIVVSTVFNIPRFLEYRLVTQNDRVAREILSLSNNEVYIVLYKTALYYIIIYTIPVIVLATTSWLLIKNQRARKQICEQGSSDVNRVREELTRMLLLVCLIFIICQLSNPIRRVWEAMMNETPVCGDPYYYFSPLVAVMVMFNSAINFFIYMFCGTRFRKTIMSMLCCHQNKVSPGGESGSYHMGDTAAAVVSGNP